MSKKPYDTLAQPNLTATLVNVALLHLHYWSILNSRTCKRALRDLRVQHREQRHGARGARGPAATERAVDLAVARGARRLAPRLPGEPYAALPFL